MDPYKWNLEEKYQSSWGEIIHSLQRTLQMTTDSLIDELNPFFSIPALYRCSSSSGAMLEPMQGGVLESIRVDADTLTLTVIHSPVSQSKFSLTNPRGKLTVWRVNNQLDMLQVCFSQDGLSNTSIYMQVGGEKTLSLFAAHDDLPTLPVDIQRAKMLYLNAQSCTEAQIS